MKPIKFRIINFKSILDSGECFFEPGYTVLAGKNESGKTTILEALAAFDENAELSKKTRPIGTNLESEIYVTFEISKDELIEELGEYHSKNLSFASKEIIIIKKTNEGYSIENDLKLPVEQNEELRKKTEARIEKIIEDSELKEDTKKWLFDKGLVLEDWEYDIPKWFENPTNANIYGKTFNITGHPTDVFTNIQEEIEQFRKNDFNRANFLDSLIGNQMPFFVLFDSFDDIFPDNISIDSIEDNSVVKDLEQVSDFKISEIISEDSQIQANHENQVNANFSDVFEEYWSQDKIKLVVRKDGDKVNFWIEENQKLFKPSQRSKGQQWYLSFYIKIVSKMQSSIPNVILIDEPGLYLHAKAQKDLLKVLEKQFKMNILVFSTHSPYLIEENRLNNIRLIEKNDGITTVVGKPWSKIADKETLTPILTAIGLGLGDSISDRFKDNIICEGMEEVIYLQAFQYVTGNHEEYNFINGGGAPKLEFFGRILEAWELNVKYLFDNDTAGKRAGNKILRDNPAALVEYASDSQGESTIDLISIEDFKKIMLEDESIEVVKNSVYLKNEGLDKVIMARKFLNQVKFENVLLSSTTMTNINQLMERLRFPD